MKLFEAKRQVGAVAILTAAVIVLSGCSPDGGSNEGGAPGGDLPELDASYAAELDQLYKDAVEAGQTKVVIYSNQEDMPTLNARFNERYPKIKIQLQRLVNTEVTAKLEQEVATGNHVADLILSSTHEKSRMDQGWYEKYRPVTITEDTLHPVGFRSHDYFNSAIASAYGLAYNTTKVSKEDAPKSYEDLLDPKWKGKIIFGDPTKAGGTSVIFSILEAADRLDEQWLRDLAAQDGVIIASTPQAVQGLATGQGDVAWGMSLSYVEAAKADGAPLEYVFPMDDGNAILTQTAYALVADAKNDIAAKLFYSWAFTPEAQEEFANLYYYPLMAGVPGPAGFPAVDEIEVAPLPDDEDRAPLLSSVMDRSQGIF